MGHRLALLIAATTLLSACGPELLYHRDPTVTIPAGASWTWSAPDGDGLAPHDGAVTPPDSIARLIAAAIERELQARGYPRTSGELAEFVVHYHVGRRTVIDTLPPRDDPLTVAGGVRQPGSWGGYGRPEEIEDRTIFWDEGMLIVDVLPRDRRTIAWRGAIVGEIPPSADRDVAPALGRAIRQLLRGFP